MRKIFVVLALFAGLGMAAFAQSAAGGAKKPAAEPQTPGPAQTTETAAPAAGSTAAPKMESAVMAVADAAFAEPYGIVTGDRLTLIAQKVYGDYRLWPALWLPNEDMVPDPDIIEPNVALKVAERLYTGPVGMEEKAGLIVAYLAAYKQYKSFGPTRTDSARWVLYEAALFFDASTAQPYASQVDAADIAWLQSVLR